MFRVIQLAASTAETSLKYLALPYEIMLSPASSLLNSIKTPRPTVDFNFPQKFSYVNPQHSSFVPGKLFKHRSSNTFHFTIIVPFLMFLLPPQSYIIVLLVFVLTWVQNCKLQEQRLLFSMSIFFRYLANYFSFIKGSKIFVEFSLRTDFWDTRDAL